MSMLCTILLDCLPSEIDDLKRLLMAQAKNSEWGVYFNYPTEFPHSENFIVDLSDDLEYPNCELLLNPDGCTFNGKPNKHSFAKRMLYVRDMILTLLQKTDELSLFIGDSSPYLGDYELVETSGAEIYSELLKHNDFSYPTMHYIIRKT